jgi:DNA-binding PadR family transcriptional regulator
MSEKAEILSEASTFILLALAEPLHGYGIIKKVEQMSDGRVRLGPGTLYGALTKMVKKGWILPLPVENGARRKVYKLTTLGHKQLQNEMARLTALVGYGEAALAAWKDARKDT